MKSLALYLMLKYMSASATIHAEAGRHRLDPILVSTVTAHESGFDDHAIGPDGKDIGLMQLRLTGAGRGYTKKQLFNPQTNIRVGTAYLASMIARCHSVKRGLGAYNLGPRHCSNNEYSRAVWREYHLRLKQTS